MQTPFLLAVAHPILGSADVQANLKLVLLSRMPLIEVTAQMPAVSLTESLRLSQTIVLVAEVSFYHQAEMLHAHCDVSASQVQS